MRRPPGRGITTSGGRAMSGEAAQPGAVRTILVPLALAPVAEALRAAVVAEARAFGARVVLLHVLPPRVAPTDAGVCQAEAGAQAFLESVAAQMTGAGVRARAAVRFGATAAAFLAEAAAVGGDLIGMVGGGTRQI